MEIPAEVLEALVKTTDELNKLDDEYDAKVLEIQIPFRKELEQLYAERQPQLERVDGFWSTVLNAQDAPTKEFLNATIDPKILRAITSVKVQTEIRNGAIFRKVIFTLRQNMFVESTLLSREVSSKTETSELSGIVWKPGTDKARKDSFFRFFERDAEKDFVQDVLEAVEEVFASPLLFLASHTA